MMGFDEDPDKVTSLYFEMYICSEILHGMQHRDFLELPFEEQLKWKLYATLKNKKEDFHIKKISNRNKTESDAGRTKNKNRR